MLIRSSVDHEEKIFVILFHQVFFPRKFFKGSAVGHQPLVQRGIPVDFIQVELLFLVQLIELLLHPLSREDVVRIEKNDPYPERNRREEVFVQKDL